MNRGTVSEDNSFGPDGYQGAPPDIAEALDSGVFVEDTFPSPEDLRREVKRTVSIRLDPDVYAWFKLPGPGYQTRINAVLRAYMTAQISKKGSAIVGAAAKPAIIIERLFGLIASGLKCIKGVQVKAHVRATIALRQGRRKEAVLERENPGDTSAVSNHALLFGLNSEEVLEQLPRSFKPLLGQNH